MRLYHFSEEAGIEVFAPRAPLLHPDSEPLVYAIEDAWSPLYFFPRDCPRIGVCDGGRPFRLLIDSRFEDAWRHGRIYRYRLDPSDGFVSCHDHGVFVSRETVAPLGVELLADLPKAVAECGIEIEVVPSLAQAAEEFYDFDQRRFKCSWHVSMIRMRLLADWPFEPGSPVVPDP